MAGENERAPPSLLAGRYVLGESFASGGMGSVHLGRIVGASGFSRVVAIKRLFPGFATDASFRQMLLDEARFASRIRHPNVVPILDVVEAERDLYVVMEYVHGLPLAALLARSAHGTSTPVPIPIAIAIAESVLFGLHAAHEARDEDGTPLGIVHRDVSPQNVIIAGDGAARLIDFGIAKAATRMQVTDPGVLKGKSGYMAPEQFLHELVARNADVFAASVVLWEMLAGRNLFPFDVGERARRAAEPAVPPSRHRPEVDPALDAVVLRGLERDPARRFPTAEAMALELRRDRPVATAVEVARWLGDVAADELELSEERVRLFEQSSSLGLGAGDGPMTPPPVTAAPTVSTIPDAWLARPNKRRRRRAWLIALAATLVAVTALAAFRLSPLRPRGPAVEPLAGIAQPASSPPPPSPPVASPPAAPVPVVAPSPPSAAASKPSSRTHRATKSKCDPPYTVDADGFKHYDPRCF